VAATAWLIANPRAGRKGGFILNPTEPGDALAALRRHEIDAELHVTERPAQATLLARHAVAAGAQLVVVAGGDGTIHEVASGLVGSGAALGILPLGSMMNLPRALGIPRDLDAAAALIARGRLVRMEVGRVTTAAGQSYFFEAAGAGVDAGAFAFGNQLDAGKWNYLLPFLRFVTRYRPRAARLTVDGRLFTVPRSIMISAAVSPFIGLQLTVAPEAKVDDHLLDVVVRQASGRLDLLRHAAVMAWGDRRYGPNTHLVRGRVVEIEHVHRPMPVHADARIVGRTPARLELLPETLPVVVGDPHPERHTGLTPRPHRRGRRLVVQ
jgi:YegS/Rv2252/BmrU family lipid kinase